MSRTRELLLLAAALMAVVVVQTAVFRRIEIFGVVPDLLVVAIALAGLRLRGERLLVVAFVAGLVMDALSADALGLRAVAYALIAYTVVRTRERADVSPLAVAVWIALLSALLVLLMGLLGTLFGQLELAGGGLVRRLVGVPLLDLVVALVLWPLVTRLQTPYRRGL